MTGGFIKAIGIGASILGVGATLVSDWINDIKMEEAIEEKAGFSLLWNRINNKKAASISTDIPGLDFDNQQNYPELMNEVIDKVIALRAAFSPFINS